MTTSSAISMKAKLFVYLDEYKMYSISSQLFEGLTEEVIQYQLKKKENKEEQQGPLGSGRLLGDIISESNGRAERRFLFDYAYTIFESRILDENLVSCISEENKVCQLDAIEKSFVKVTGKIRFNDFTAVQRIIESLNKMNDALQYVSTFEERSSRIAELRIQIQAAESKLKKELHQTIRTLSSWKSDSQIDQEYISNLAYLLDFGYGDHLEAQITLTMPDSSRTKIVTAILNRECMRESMAMEIKKYSRRPDQLFTILGVVTQKGKPRLDESNALKDIESESAEEANMLENEEESSSIGLPSHLKTHISSMLEHVAEIESGFTGCLENEIIIDPIAIYREV
jgi:hypothetical protein